MNTFRKSAALLSAAFLLAINNVTLSADVVDQKTKASFKENVKGAFHDLKKMGKQAKDKVASKLTPTQEQDTKKVHREEHTVKTPDAHEYYDESSTKLYDREAYRKPKVHTHVTAKHKDTFIPEAAIENVKSPVYLTHNDTTLTIGGATKIENYFQRNVSLLNKQIPDEFEYFKSTFDLNFDFAWGERQFGYKAIEAYVGLVNKSIWGKGSAFLDAEPNEPTMLQLSDTRFGSHTHQQGRPFTWIREGWMRASLNAILGAKSDKNHYIKLGWFPLSFGRGIALGNAYGMTRDLVALYNQVEEKAAPGINITGELVKDCLEYDLYYSRFEEHGKNLRDTFNVVKAHRLDVAKPWRGTGKNNDLVGARLKWKALDESRYGSLNVEPYILYNNASDQSIEKVADAKTELGTVGFAFDHTYNNVEISAETAFNFGRQIAYSIDRNEVAIKRGDDGKLQEYFTHIVNATTNENAVLTAENRSLNKDLTQNDKTKIVHGFKSADDRFRNEYKSNFGGWMGVFDIAYNVPSYNVKFAGSIGCASGDEDLDNEQKDKKYKGFIGINEIYSGKFVKSILLLDERQLHRPVVITKNGSKGDVYAIKDMSFTNLRFVGTSANWNPSFMKHKKLNLNPNIMFFWNDHKERKISLDSTTGKARIMDDTTADSFLGTELNLLASAELLPDLKLFANFALFVPGQFFKDVAGIPLKDDYFSKVASGLLPTGTNPQDYRLKYDNAYHVNVGLTYKF